MPKRGIRTRLPPEPETQWELEGGGNNENERERREKEKVARLESGVTPAVHASDTFDRARA